VAEERVQPEEVRAPKEDGGRQRYALALNRLVAKSRRLSALLRCL
jgi:hypothetical protein